MKSELKKEVYWYTKKKPEIKKLEKNKAADVVIVGGGMAGLAAAKRLCEAGQKIILLECSFCGGGASGKSSGFITPDSEMGFGDLLSDYGKDEAVKIYEFATAGVNQIRQNIKDFNIDCDFQIQDSIFVANSKKGLKKIEEDRDARTRFKYHSQFYSREQLPTVIGSKEYFGGLRYPETFGINAYLYCQAMKAILLKRGVEIYENSPVTEILYDQVKTESFSVKAKKIIVATDKFLPELNIRKKDIYHVQTFLTVSKILSEAQIKSFFPEKPLMVWDTDLIYQYFRLIEGNRLLFGAANLLYTYKHNESKSFEDVLNKIQRYLKNKFGITDIEFEYTWPGLIGVTKDLVPIAGEDPQMKNVFYISGASGLPWASALGHYMAEKIINGRSEMDSFFRADRHYPVGKKLQAILRKPLSFAISHGIVEYFQ